MIGIDNDMRARFFGAEASTAPRTERLASELPGAFRTLEIDIRDRDAVDARLRRARSAIELVVHAAAQPSHDWAARDPHTDFTVNANGTLNLLEAGARHTPDATFIFTSTNKVYGDRPNELPLDRDARRGWSCPRTTSGSAASPRACRSTAPRTRSSASRRRPPT